MRRPLCVVAEHGLHDVGVEGVAGEERRIRLEEDVCAVLVLRLLGGVARELPSLERGAAHVAVAVGAHLEARAEGVDGLHAHAVEADALLERLRVVLAAGVEHAHGLDELALGYAAAVVAHADAEVLVDVHLDAVAGVHLELVDGVVYHFLQEHVYAVFGQRAVAQPPDVHPGAGAHVLHVRQVAYVVVGVFYGLLALRYVFFFGHASFVWGLG